MKTWFITGISRGLGRSLAQAALSRGDRVIGTIRDQAPDLHAAPEQLLILKLDMTEATTIIPAVQQAFDWAGRIDIIVNNAGYGLLGPLEQVSDPAMARLFEVDLFGPFRLIRAALPRLRAQGGGHIINITSIAGRAPNPASVLYSSAKYAMEGLSAGLSREVAPLGIKVTAVAPGAFRTDFLSDHSIRRTEGGDDAYAASVGASLGRLGAMAGQQKGDPDRAAQALLSLADAENPPVHLLLGSDAWQRMKVKLTEMEAEMEAWRDVTLSTDFPDQ
ncbi:SDR family NAD(P)-dependent oxidoreductase [Niveispirillum irakense]|uniref:SDR family NAD(P)-dependent oxidoreductase n=1 Tax=Niveispirillum irakense TaxID=34011 RepID=UPI0003FC5F3F|nr:SDR family NAD(P)-dependent oxidoreductase [Niveispirillum irakense]